MNEWEISFRTLDDRLGRNMFVVRRARGGVEVLRPDFKTIDFVPLGDEIKCTIHIPQGIYDGMVKSILENNKPLNGSFVEGQVEAMKEHLSDMRDIVFKDYPIKNIQVKTDEKN